MTLAELLTVLGGLAAGAIHVVVGPDHLAAVLPFAVEKPKSAWRVGLSWGVGHGAAVVLLGALGQLFKERFDVTATSAYAEITAGILLVALGAWTLYRTRVLVLHTHPHDHERDPEQDDHVHPHVHVGDQTVGRADHPVEGRHARHTHSAFAFGGLHGIAGTSHLLGVLPSLVLSGLAAWLYLGLFVVGSTASMGGFAWLAGSTVARYPTRVRWALRGAGAFALVVGVFWIARFSGFA